LYGRAAIDAVRSGKAAHPGGDDAASKLAHNIGNSLVHSMTEANPPRRRSLVASSAIWLANAIRRRGSCRRLTTTIDRNRTITAPACNSGQAALADEVIE